jgi:hypothetical protein
MLQNVFPKGYVAGGEESLLSLPPCRLDLPFCRLGLEVTGRLWGCGESSLSCQSQGGWTHVAIEWPPAGVNKLENTNWHWIMIF